MINKFFLFNKQTVNKIFAPPVNSIGSILELEVIENNLELTPITPIIIEITLNIEMIKIRFTHNDSFPVATDISKALNSLNITSNDITDIVMSVNTGRDFTTSQLTKSIANGSLVLNENQLYIVLTPDDYLLIRPEVQYNIYFKFFWGADYDFTFEANTLFIKPQQVP